MILLLEYKPKEGSYARESIVTDPSVIYERRRGASWMTLNRPDALNALTVSVMEDLDAGLSQVEHDDDVRVLVLTGRGRAFCAGVDLKALAEHGDPRRATLVFMEKANPILERLERFEKPVIAAVNGLALAGGLELVLCCDLVVAASGARFGDAHANYGLIPGGGASVRLPRKIGVTRSKYLLFSGQTVSAKFMREAGLVNEVVPDAELHQAVDTLVTVLAAKSPLGLQRMKRLVDNGLRQSPEAALALETALALDHCTSADAQEGLAAFAEKRPPRFGASAPPPSRPRANG